MKKGDHLFLVDGSGYIFRAYHGLPPLSRKSDGLPVGAVAGFCQMLWKLMVSARDTEVGVVPSHFAVIFDYSSKTFRNALYKDYKANRSAPPEDLVPQFGLIREATRAFDLPCIEIEGFEADDLIATYCRLATEAGGDTTIISSDKDLMQLVSPQVAMYDPMKDREIREAEVMEKWGVPPEKMVDLQALTGDSVDNVPGVPGIGPKTAAQLLAEFGDLDTLLARAGEIKQQKRREVLIANADNARLSRELVRLRADAPVPDALDDLKLGPPNGPKLIAFLKAMEFSALTRRVADATGTDPNAVDKAAVPIEEGDEAHGPDLEASAPEPGEAPLEAEKAPASSADDVMAFILGDAAENPVAPAPGKANGARKGEGRTPAQLAEKRLGEAANEKLDVSAYVAIRDLDTLRGWIAEATEAGVVAFDTETTSLDPMQAELAGFSLCSTPGKAAYVPLIHKAGVDDLLGGGLVENQIDTRAALDLLKPMLEDPSVLKVAQNLKYDLVVMQRHGVDIRGYDDTMLISYVLDAGKGGHGMDALSERWLNHRTIAFKDVAGTGKSTVTFDHVAIDRATQYAAEDADVTLRLWRALKPRLVAEGLVAVYERLERPLVPVLAGMEQHGISVDRDMLSRISGELAQTAARLEDEVYELAGEKFAIGSPKQLGDILFGRMKLPGGSKTKTGQWSTSVFVLEELAAEGHALPRKIVDWRQVTKLKSTYTDALPEYVNPDTKRVHTSFAMAATTTGRLSSSDPNLQNIPIRTAEGRRIRTAFVAEPGNKLISADYSQIELRLLAHIADIPELKHAFAEGLDIHAATAAEMFGMDVGAVPPDVRRRAKTINFGIIYGISSFGLATRLGIGREEAGDYIKRYFERFPGIRDYIEGTKKSARDKLYVETIFGRRVHYPDMKSPNQQTRAFNERAAINAPIQGSAADIIRRAMIRMDDALKAEKLSARMLLQVHDELIFEAPEAEIDETIRVARAVMEDAPMPAINLSVPLQVDARAADNWEEAH
jgi:DNA polymerase I